MVQFAAQLDIDIPRRTRGTTTFVAPNGRERKQPGGVTSVQLTGPRRLALEHIVVELMEARSLDVAWQEALDLLFAKYGVDPAEFECLLTGGEVSAAA